MKERLSIFINLIWCALAFTNALVATNIDCGVDYHGIIVFSINLPKGYESWENLKPRFYYKNDGDIKNWTEEKDCSYGNIDDKLQCSMQILSDMGRLNSYLYYFKLAIVENGKVSDVEKLYFANKGESVIAPWIRYNKLPFCSGGYGVKYIATNASVNSIDIEWLLYPIDAYSRGAFTSQISIVSKNTKKERFHVIKDEDNENTHCSADVCKYKFQNLKSCTKYEICIETKSISGDDNETKVACRDVQTYCTYTSKRLFAWQDILLCIFGSVMLIICVVMFWVLCNKHSQFGIVFGHHNTENEIIDQDDLVYPVNENKVDFLSMYKEQYFQHPFQLVNELTKHVDDSVRNQ